MGIAETFFFVYILKKIFIAIMRLEVYCNLNTSISTYTINTINQSLQWRVIATIVTGASNISVSISFKQLHGINTPRILILNFSVYVQTIIKMCRSPDIVKAYIFQRDHVYCCLTTYIIFYLCHIGLGRYFMIERGKRRKAMFVLFEIV